MRRSTLVISTLVCLLLAGGLVLSTAPYAQGASEHAGEHPGAEQDPTIGQAGEHPAETDTDEKTFTANEIQDAIKTYIKTDQKLKGGYFYIHDSKLDYDWKLQFSKLHPVRIITRDGQKIYFACTNFEVLNHPDHDVLDLDFWMRPDKHGELEPYKIRIHKVDGKARFTYEDDRPVEQ